MAMQKLAQEDPTFRVHTDEISSQTIISGMGELHLEIIVDRMMREFKCRPMWASRRCLPRDRAQERRGGGQVHSPDGW